MASDAFTTKSAHKQIHYYVKQAFDPEIKSKCPEIQKANPAGALGTEADRSGSIVGPHYSFINRGQSVHNAIRLI